MIFFLQTESASDSKWNFDFSKLIEKLQGWGESLILKLPNFIIAILVFCVFWFLAKYVSKLVRNVIMRGVKQDSIRVMGGKTAFAITVLIGFFIALGVMDLDKVLTSVLAGAGVVGLAIGLALQGTLNNTFSGVILSFMPRLQLGDWVETNDYSGFVEDITLRNVTLRQSDNNYVIVPNSSIVDSPFKNWSQTARSRIFISCGVGYESDLEAVKKLTLETLKKDDDEGTEHYKYIFNAHKRENFQRNQISKALDKANEDDLIMISDVDEIPNLKDLNVAKVNNKIVIFEQEIFYYKLNRYLEGFTWHGTKACKKKNLKSPQWIRNVKNKKFGFWRLDTFFSETKYINKIFIKSGGWHFSNLKNPVDIENKLKSYLHHRDFDVENIDLKEISKLMRNNETIYDMFADKREKKFSENKRKLNLYPKNKLPQYILANENKFKEWLD